MIRNSPVLLTTQQTYDNQDKYKNQGLQSWSLGHIFNPQNPGIEHFPIPGIQN